MPSYLHNAHGGFTPAAAVLRKCDNPGTGTTSSSRSAQGRQERTGTALPSSYPCSVVHLMAKGNLHSPKITLSYVPVSGDPVRAQEITERW